MAAVNSVVAQRFVAFQNFNPTVAKPKPSLLLPSTFSFSRIRIAGGKRWQHLAAAMVMTEEVDVIPVRSGDSTDQQSGVSTHGGLEGEVEESDIDQQGHGTDQIGGFAFEGGAGGGGVGGSGGGVGFSSPASPSSSPTEGKDLDKMVDRVINASIVLATGTFAITKLLTIDRDYWHGWTLYEIVRYAPLHNWTAYEEALKTNPVFAKMMISGVVYSIGDWIAQPLFEFDRVRMLRSGLTGFALHGSLSHYYYEICEYLFPFHDWWVVPAKVAFDQTIWSAIWNSVYFVVLGFLRFESPANIFNELKDTFWPMLTAGWKLWPVAHLITYGFIPVEQRLLWVDCVELVWVMILSTYSNVKSEAKHTQAKSELGAESIPAASEETKK
ncbi:hypothetical protein HPP92_014057 [Vanilla planifolia]|uniref:Peroxisomal membrane protein 2 n=1 Tax=Vanilla planifolia TaxID=51239 RepID=A0A835QPK0_VANPL|nr:hypothetical protein HPP92_014057 [Vanilla planifolia]